MEVKRSFSSGAALDQLELKGSLGPGMNQAWMQPADSLTLSHLHGVRRTSTDPYTLSHPPELSQLLREHEQQQALHNQQAQIQQQAKVQQQIPQQAQHNQQGQIQQQAQVQQQAQHNQQGQNQQQDPTSHTVQDQEDFLQALLDGMHPSFAPLPDDDGCFGGDAFLGGFGLTDHAQPHWNVPGIPVASADWQPLGSGMLPSLDQAAQIETLPRSAYINGNVMANAGSLSGENEVLEGESRVKRSRKSQTPPSNPVLRPKGRSSGGGRGSRGGRVPHPRQHSITPEQTNTHENDGTEQGTQVTEQPTSTSKFRGVTRHKRSGRWEAHIWVREMKKQIYLGGYEHEEHAAEAYDVAALRTKGKKAQTNFEVERYQGLLDCMGSLAPEELWMAVRRQSQGHSRGSSAFRGVTSHPSGRWESRIGVPGSKHVYLGLFDDEGRLHAYDRSLVRLRGANAATNSALGDYGKEMKEHLQAQAIMEAQGQPLESIMTTHEFENWVKFGVPQDNQGTGAIDFPGFHSFIAAPQSQQDFLTAATAAAMSLPGLPDLNVQANVYSLPSGFSATGMDPVGGFDNNTAAMPDMQQLLQQIVEASQISGLSVDQGS